MSNNSKEIERRLIAENQQLREWLAQCANKLNSAGQVMISHDATRELGNDLLDWLMMGENGKSPITQLRTDGEYITENPSRFDLFTE